jgi:hypothetical protein
MVYKVVFRKRFDVQGEEADRPETFVRVVDGIVLNAVKAESNEPPALHVQETLDEDDNFMSLGTETWEYEIADGREQEFIDALRQSQMVLQYESIDEMTAS